jgi:hypothetical protein
MFCNACGADQGNRSFKFCPQCGAPLQAETSGPETAAAPSISADPAIAAPYPELPPAAKQVETAAETAAITPLSSITVDATPAFDFVPLPTADASKADEPPVMPAKTASGPSEDRAASLPWREVQQREKNPKYAPRCKVEKAQEDAEPAKTLPDIPPEPEKNAANACPEQLAPDAPVVLPPAAEPPHTGQHADQHAAEAEPTPPPAVLNLAKNPPATPDLPPPAIEPDVLAPFPEREKKYAFEISTTASEEQWDRIEPTMSGSRDFPPQPIAPPPKTNARSTFAVARSTLAVIGAGIALIFALSGLLWLFSRSNSTPETFREDTLGASSEPPASQATETNETPQTETLAVPARETDEPLSEFDPASRMEPEAPLMAIPNLPANQQPGNHNRTDDIVEPLPDAPSTPAPASSSPPTASSAPSTASSTQPPRSSATNIAPIPLPQPPTQRYGADDADTGNSRQNPVRTAAAPPIIEPELEPPRTAMPQPPPSPIAEPEQDTHRTRGTEFSGHPPAQREAPRTGAPSQPTAAQEGQQQDSSSWRNRLRQELSSCEDFFCRERVRGQYCTSRWKTLPECRGASL